MSLLITAVIAILTIAANATINIKIKFAPNAATASRELVALGLGIAGWVFNGLTMVGLVVAVASPAPVTRFVVFQIALSIAALLFSLGFLALKDLSGAVLRMGKLQLKQAEVTERIVGVIERQAGDPSSAEKK